jgi:hypothetical protein
MKKKTQFKSLASLFLDMFSMVAGELNKDRLKQIQGFQENLQRFVSHRVDPMEFFLLKSIVIYKSG